MSTFDNQNSETSLLVTQSNNSSPPASQPDSRNRSRISRGVSAFVANQRRDWVDAFRDLRDWHIALAHPFKAPPPKPAFTDEEIANELSNGWDYGHIVSEERRWWLLSGNYLDGRHSKNGGLKVLTMILKTAERTEDSGLVRNTSVADTCLDAIIEFAKIVTQDPDPRIMYRKIVVESRSLAGEMAELATMFSTGTEMCRELTGAIVGIENYFRERTANVKGYQKDGWVMKEMNNLYGLYETKDDMLSKLDELKKKLKSAREAQDRVFGIR